MTAQQLELVVSELQPLIGARIQRVDVVAEREVVLELRVPGRTLRLLLSARTQLGALCLVHKRPRRLVPPGQMQALLRARLVGQALIRLRVQGRTVELTTRRLQVCVRIDGGKSAFKMLPPPDDLPQELEAISIPESFTMAQSFGQAHADRAPEEADRLLRTALSRTLRARRRKLTRLLGKLQGDEKKHASFQDAGADGELLKAELHRIKRGASEVDVTDWATGTTRTVKLDPRLSAKRNLELLFSRSKRAARGLPRVQARLRDVRTQVEALDGQLAALQSASSEQLVAWSASWADAPQGRTPAAKGKRAPKAHPLDKWSRRFEALDGTQIRVGKGAKANDRLTFSGAHGDDIWLHARGTAGAHVIVSNSKGRSPSPEALLDAAHLAAHYSSAKNDSKVEVMHTEVRHVKKTKGAPAGSVGVAKSKTFLVRMDAKRLDRLLGRGEI